jgi:hypothetical protein
MSDKQRASKNKPTDWLNKNLDYLPDDASQVKEKEKTNRTPIFFRKREWGSMKRKDLANSLVGSRSAKPSKNASPIPVMIRDYWRYLAPTRPQKIAHGLIFVFWSALFAYGVVLDPPVNAIGILSLVLLYVALFPVNVFFFHMVFYPLFRYMTVGPQPPMTQTQRSVRPPYRPSQNGQTLRAKPGRRMHMNAQEFEEYCVEWAVYLGYSNVSTTKFSQDGGIDVIADGMYAQCKFQELPVGVKPIRELNGVSQPERKKPVFFSINGYTKDALAEGEKYNMDLWVVKPIEGEIYKASQGNLMDEGDFHSGPEGYSANTAYPETQYGSGFDDEAEWNRQ